MVAFRLDDAACVADAALAHFGKISPEIAQSITKDISELAPFQDVRCYWEGTERFLLLDLITWMARHQRFHDSDKTGLLKGVMSGMSDLLVDGDEVLRQMNSAFDRASQVAKHESLLEQLEEGERFHDELRALQVASKRKLSRAELLLKPRAALTERIAGVYVSTMVPHVTLPLVAKHRAEGQVELVKIAMALGCYRSEHRRYPAELSDLVPNYLSALPIDPGTGEPYAYELGDFHCLLYSELNEELATALEPQEILLRLPPETRE